MPGRLTGDQPLRERHKRVAQDQRGEVAVHREATLVGLLLVLRGSREVVEVVTGVADDHNILDRRRAAARLHGGADQLANADRWFSRDRCDQPVTDAHTVNGAALRYAAARVEREDLVALGPVVDRQLVALVGEPVVVEDRASLL